MTGDESRLLLNDQRALWNSDGKDAGTVVAN